MSYVVVNVLTVPADQRETLEARFAARAGAVEHSEGFEHFELLRPSGDGERYLVYTRWRDEASFRAWLGGQSHGGGQPGQRPAATGSEVWEFEVVTSAGTTPR